MERLPKASEVTPIAPKTPDQTPKPESESIPKKRGRPRKNAVDDEAPRKKGIDVKNSKVL